MQDSEVELSLVDGKLILTAVGPERITLDTMLRGITEENMHAEGSTSEALGNESW